MWNSHSGGQGDSKQVKHIVCQKMISVVKNKAGREMSCGGRRIVILKRLKGTVCRAHISAEAWRRWEAELSRKLEALLGEGSFLADWTANSRAWRLEHAWHVWGATRNQCTCGLMTEGEMAGEEVTLMLGMWDSGPFYTEWPGEPLQDLESRNNIPCSA